MKRLKKQSDHNKSIDCVDSPMVPFDLDPRQRFFLGLGGLLDDYDNETRIEYQHLKAEYQHLKAENQHLKEDNLYLREDNQHLKEDKQYLKEDNLYLREDNIKKDNEISELKAALRELQSRGKRTAKKVKGKLCKNFSTLIQDKNRQPEILKRLHELIDGNSGMDVGAVLKRAEKDKLLSRVPTEGEFKTEFELIGSWRAVTDYFDDSKHKVKQAVDNIRILE